MAMAKGITLRGSRGADLAIVFGVSVFDDAKLNLVLESDSEPKQSTGTRTTSRTSSRISSRTSSRTS
jgi:hypothetical protein